MVDVAESRWLKDGRDLQGCKPLLFQDLVILRSFWSLTESIAVRGLIRELTEDFLGFILVQRVEIYVVSDWISHRSLSLVLESFHALQIHHRADYSKPL